ncbi:integration host factor, actinobacterial type [Rothia sp. P6271]|uniref:integration host factor, actinobacterial type n=1 Tax=unclassified Rothia (in: high G+C Gram-positive bacteria) TaxID=2689056 RepID=UPI003AC1A2DA
MALRPLTEEERAAAREKAKVSRTIRAEVKESLKKRETTIAEVLKRADSEEAVSRLKVTDLLMALPSIGEIRANAILKELNIAPSRRLRGLGVHQRRALIDFLER